MNFGMLRGIFKSHLEMPSFCYPGASRNKSGINSSAIGFMFLVAAFCLSACGDDSGTSVKEESSSSFVIPDSVPGSVSTSSKKLSSSSRMNSVGSSNMSVLSSSIRSSSSQKTAKSSSSGVVWTCNEEGKVLTKTNPETKLLDAYICTNGAYVLAERSSSSQKVLTFKENFKKDSVFNDQIEFELRYANETRNNGI